jgi:hypothetical protein
MMNDKWEDGSRMDDGAQQACRRISKRNEDGSHGTGTIDAKREFNFRCVDSATAQPAVTQ